MTSPETETSWSSSSPGQDLELIQLMIPQTAQLTWAWSYKQKNTENFLEIWSNFLFLGNSYRFSNCVPIKNFLQFFRNLSSQLHQNNLAKNFLASQKKLLVQKLSSFPEKCLSFSEKFSEQRVYVYRIKSRLLEKYKLLKDQRSNALLKPAVVAEWFKSQLKFKQSGYRRPRFKSLLGHLYGTLRMAVPIDY